MRESKTNNMRTPEEKEKIVKKYLSGKLGFRSFCSKYNVSSSVLWRWIKIYKENVSEGLKSKTGKARYSNPHAGLHFRKPKNKIEELELELMKKEIEIARLKKGYIVKGVGAEKEFVTTFDKNTK